MDDSMDTEILLLNEMVRDDLCFQIVDARAKELILWPIIISEKLCFEIVFDPLQTYWKRCFYFSTEWLCLRTCGHIFWRHSLINARDSIYLYVIRSLLLSCLCTRFTKLSQWTSISLLLLWWCSRMSIGWVVNQLWFATVLHVSSLDWIFLISKATSFHLIADEAHQEGRNCWQIRYILYLQTLVILMQEPL